MSAAPVLRAESISKSYGHRRVLTAARIEARAGEIVLIAGRNGAGKSTLLRIVAGEIAGDSGVVHFGGLVSANPRLAILARYGLFFLPDRNILTPALRIRTQLEAVAARFGTTAALQSAEVLGISALLDHKPLDISQGELRRAELALALARQPSCLIADEPLRGIDPKDADHFLATFRALSDAQCAVIISGHEIRPLMSVADRVVWVTAGTTHDLGSAETAQRNEHFRKEYLLGRWN